MAKDTLESRFLGRRFANKCRMDALRFVCDVYRRYMSNDSTFSNSYLFFLMTFEADIKIW